MLSFPPLVWYCLFHKIYFMLKRRLQNERQVEIYGCGFMCVGFVVMAVASTGGDDDKPKKRVETQ